MNPLLLTASSISYLLRRAPQYLHQLPLYSSMGTAYVTGSYTGFSVRCRGVRLRERSSRPYESSGTERFLLGSHVGMPLGTSCWLQM